MANLNVVNAAAVAMDDNPFSLHQNENPTSIIVSAVLSERGENYHSWSRSMMMSLEMKNKLGFIDGSLPKPEVGDPTFKAWNRCNTTVLLWIFHALHPQVEESVMWMTVAVDAWNDLRRRYYHGDVFRIVELHKEIFTAKQGDLTITTYFTKLKSLWEELGNFCPILTCT